MIAPEQREGTTMENFLEDVREEWLNNLQLSPLAEDILLLLLAFLAIWLVQWFIRRVLFYWLKRLADSSTTEWDNLVLNMLSVPMRYLTLALALQAAIVILDIRRGTRDFLEHLVMTLVALAVIVLVYQFITRATRSSYMARSVLGLGVEPELLPFLSTGLRLVLIAFSIAILLELWGYDVATLTAGLGIGGLAVALAAQDTLANLFGFTTIVGDRPLVEGEYIKTPDVEGRVERVGLRSTRIRQTDQALVTIPNSMLAQSVVMNWSRLEKRQLNFTLQLSSDTTTAYMMRVLLEQLRDMLRDHPTVEEDSVVVYFTDVTETGLKVLIRCYILRPNWADYTAEKEQINLKILEILEDLQVDTSYTVIHIGNLPESLPELRMEQNLAASTDRPSGRITLPPSPPSDEERPDVPPDLANRFPEES